MRETLGINLVRFSNMTIKANISSRVRIGGTGLPVLLPKPVGVISGPSVLPGVSTVKISW